MACRHWRYTTTYSNVTCQGDGVMKYFYDTEFLEDGRTIELISIGIVAEDGREYYAVAMPNRSMVRRIRRHEWLMANVVPSLPRPHGDWILHMPNRWLFNYHDPVVKSRSRIADEVREFLIDQPELWAWYAAYDHVALCQLWGRMIDLPYGIPMWTNDLKQECYRLGNPRVPVQDDGEHHALSDARHLRKIDEFLRQKYM
jgi:3' exoribonuclease, RNase T-like